MTYINKRFNLNKDVLNMCPYSSYIALSIVLSRGANTPDLGPAMRGEPWTGPGTLGFTCQTRASHARAIQLINGQYDTLYWGSFNTNRIY